MVHLLCVHLFTFFHKDLLQIYLIIPHRAGKFNAKMLIFFIFLDKNGKNVLKSSFIALNIKKRARFHELVLMHK